MKTALLLLIKLYWVLIPKSDRRKCLFRISCSRHVYAVTRAKGWRQGLIALRFRFLNCRSGYQLFRHPISDQKTLMLPTGQLLTEPEISRYLLDKIV